MKVIQNDLVIFEGAMNRFREAENYLGRFGMGKKIWVSGLRRAHEIVGHDWKRGMHGNLLLQWRGNCYRKGDCFYNKLHLKLY
jgi:hypothetical protein